MTTVLLLASSTDRGHCNGIGMKPLFRGNGNVSSLRKPASLEMPIKPHYLSLLKHA